MNSLTPREAEALALVRQSLDAFGEAPTRLELAAALGVSGPTAHEHLKRLAGKGLVTLKPRRWRGIALRDGSRGASATTDRGGSAAAFDEVERAYRAAMER